DRTHPLADIPVHLLKAPIHCEIGTLVAIAHTDRRGRFGLEAAIPASEDEPYLNLALGSEDIHVAGALSESGAHLTSEGWLQFEQVGSGDYDGNEFFVQSLVGQRLLTFPADADAHISQGSPGSNYGNSNVLRTSYTAGATSLSEQALLFFDLSAIPWNTEVQKATLYIYLQEAEGSAKVCMAVHALQEEWCEGPLCSLLPPVTWNKQPSRASAASADHVVGTEPGYRVWDVTALVQEWVSHSAWNYGMALLGEEQGDGWTRIFSSREGSHPPYLTVSVPSGTLITTPTLTKTATPVALDLQVDAIEVTQSIQCKDNPNCPDNAVPMIAGKMTFARVYIKVSGSTQDVPNVSARAIAKVGGQQLTAWAINPTITAKLTPDRAQFNDTLNFYLYGVSSSGTLEVEVNPFYTIPESNYANNKRTVSLNFVTTPPLRIVPIWIYYTEGG
ncbi:MAG: DNRLRE domain-containing protein, partial [Anaerolineae bacterium]